MTTFIRQGCGYWNVTRYPKGGEFHRAQDNMQVEIIRDLGSEVYGKLSNGETVVAGKSELGEKKIVELD